MARRPWTHEQYKARWEILSRYMPGDVVENWLDKVQNTVPEQRDAGMDEVDRLIVKVGERVPP